MTPVPYFTDRTRVVTRQRCPRLRWLAYEWRERGVSPARTSLPLLVGRLVHTGLEHVFTEVKRTGGVPEREFMREIIDGQREDIFQIAAAAGIAMDPNDDTNEYDLACEQAGLIEGMLWAYWHYALPKLLGAYEIVEVERDEAHEFGEFVGTPVGIDSACLERRPILFQHRADALLKSKFDDGLYVLSLKTKKEWDRRAENEGATDMQGLSETWAVEQRLGTRVNGVKMEYLLKGPRRPDTKGVWTQYSPLIRPWRDRTGKMTLPKGNITKHILAGAAGGEGEKTAYWSWTYDEDERGKTPRLHPSKVEPWQVWKDRMEDERAIEHWVDRLASGKIQPEISKDPLEEQFVLPMPYFRSAVKMRSWYRSVRDQEERAAAASQEINRLLEAEEYEEATRRLDLDFPQHTHSCNYPTKCMAYKFCHESSEEASKVDPIATRDFQWREAHHEPEKKMHEEVTK